MTLIALALALLVTVPVWKPATIVVYVPAELHEAETLRVVVTGPGGIDTMAMGPEIVCTGIRPGVHRVMVQDGLGRQASTVVTCRSGRRLRVHMDPRLYPRTTATLHGIVLESNSMEPIAGCAISVRGQSVSTMTVDDGTFLLEAVKPGVGLVVQAVTPRGDTMLTVASVATRETTFVDLSTARPFVSTVTKGLVSAYSCDLSRSADVQPLADISGHGHHGVLFGAAPAKNRLGGTGHATHFDGTSYAEVPHGMWQSVLPMSVSFFIRIDPSQSKTCFLLGKYLHPTGEGWSVFLEDGLLCAGYFQHGFHLSSRVSSRLDIRNNEWHHIAITVDRTALTLWVDGSRIRTRVFGSDPIYTVTQEPIRFGQLRSALGSPMEGLIGDLDDIAIYDRVLTEKEVLKLRE